MRALAGLVLLLATVRTAVAAEGESSVSVTGSFQSLIVDRDRGARTVEFQGQGAAVGVDYQRGFGDSFWLRVGVAGGAVALNGDAAGTFVGTVGLTYSVDILKYVPYVGVGAGVAVVGGGPVDTHVDPVLDLAIGIEVLASRAWTYGIEARLESFAGQTTIFVAGPRLAFKWGYF